LLWLQYKSLKLFHPFSEIAIDVCIHVQGDCTR
jgi:hypothetical protein